MSTEDKLGRILENITYIKITMASMETDLRHHIKRSDQHDVELKSQSKLINRLWLAVALLAGGGLGSSAPSVIKFLGSIM